MCIRDSDGVLRAGTPLRLVIQSGASSKSAQIGDELSVQLDEDVVAAVSYTHLPVSRVAVWEMLNTLKSRRNLTILITTHYMDEADRLCDRIAIVDHGNLVALDTPMALKASIPGNNVIEVQFVNPPADWEQRLKGLPGIESVHDEGNHMFRLLTSTGSQTTTGLVEMSVAAAVELKNLSVQNTSLDDVFVHYTGRQLRDEQVKAFGYVMPPRPGMNT